MIAIEAISAASNGVEMACLAAINKFWQTVVEAETFRTIHVALQANDQTGTDYLISILTPARLVHLKELTIDIEWPFFASAQIYRRFSRALAVRHMLSTLHALALFIQALDHVPKDPLARGLSILLRPTRPALVTPRGNPSYRVLAMRRGGGPRIRSCWFDNDMLTLTPFQKGNWARAMQTRLLHECPTVSIVTGLAFPPDFFPRDTVEILLSRFPNLRSIKLDLMCEMDEPRGWRTDFFTLQPQNGVYSLVSQMPATNISMLVLSRSTSLVPTHLDLPFQRRSQYGRIEDNSPLYAFIHAIRDYTRYLQALRFDHFAAPAHFYTWFFIGMSDPNFQWEQLVEVHINLYGDDEHTRYTLPMGANETACLSQHAQLSISKLFHAAGSAAAKMPRLLKMTIHKPRKPASNHTYNNPTYTLAVTLQFTLQPRHDVSLQTTWGSPGRLDLWALSRTPDIETIWTESVAKCHRRLQHIEWHKEECPDPMKGFGHWGKEMTGRKKQ
ncbi:hypothetical protein N0V93_009392 [Gnomoniopsis smithogilvyi]|uniref:Uncharacterized protein n=1 Tax=Gnomoniopsis smithogilvyi TaxID=1191159 RepID=A0A9W8YMQ4_9PEZI|nr:hypothetical protein N0V93_009392 [Gnomoniopsis smithogilvyi]